MHLKLYLGLLFILGICDFCKKDFVSVKRHQWRCKARIESSDSVGRHSNVVTAVESLPPINGSNDPCNTEHLTCICGKECKSLRGLKAYQRSCRTLKTFDEEYNLSLYLLCYLLMGHVLY